MMGRNGVDELARFESIFVWVLLLVSIFSRMWIFDLLAMALIVHMYFRILSRDVSKRYEENQKYVNFRYNAVVKWDKKKKRIAQRRNYRFYKCPMCRQEVRVPKGHGKIQITCPKCRETFIKHS